MTEEKSNTQSEKFAALLKKQGLDPEKYSTPEALAEELGSSKRKIKAQDRKERKLTAALKEKHITEDDEQINAEFPNDPKMQKVMRENRELKRDQATIKMQMWQDRNPDYSELQDEVEEIIASDPDVMMVSDPLAQLNLAMKLARKNADRPEGAPKEAGGHRLARGAISVTNASALPPGMASAGLGDLETELAKNNQKFSDALREAKGGIDEKKAIAKKYEQLEADIRKRFS